MVVAKRYCAPVAMARSVRLRTLTAYGNAQTAHGAAAYRCTVIGPYKPAPSNAVLTMSWLARIRRGVQAEEARESARVKLWEYEGGALARR